MGGRTLLGGNVMVENVWCPEKRAAKRLQKVTGGGPGGAGRAHQGGADVLGCSW